MGSLIIGAVLVAFAVMVFTADKGLGILVSLLALCLVLSAFTTNGPLRSTEVVSVEKLVPVNGYYVSPEGDYVTESNLHKSISNENFLVGGIPEKSVCVIPVLITTKKSYGTSFAALKEHEEFEYIISLDGK